jgi:hypothetical protein
MEELKSLFGEGSLSYEEFSQKLGEAKDIKLANLKSGNYVDKSKYEKIEQSNNEWQEKYSTLSESTRGYEQLQATYDALKSDYDALVTKQEETEKMGLINSSNVNPKFAKFVYAEVSSLVNESKDFKTALGEYLKDNKEFLNQKQGTYVNLEGGTPQPKTANEKMNNFIRSKLK